MRELWGLFVEDATLTVGIIGAVLIAAFAFPSIAVPGWLRGPGLFLLVVLALVENVIRSARPRRRPSAQ
jgi:hypothetical protein